MKPRLKPKIGYAKVNMTGNTITGSTVNGINIQENVQAAEADENAEILRELRETRKKLEETEPLLADALETLEKAVQEKDSHKVERLVSGFAKGTAKAALVKVASDALLSWMNLK